MCETISINVFFRKWDDGGVIALWEDSETGDMISSYQHFGQHSPAHFQLVSELEVADQGEYAALKQELQDIGYDVTVNTERHCAIFK